MSELASKYDPKAVEDRRFAEWEREGYFRADPSAAGEAFSIVIPPPNVTGVLHMGHALNETLQDILTRWHRMQGRNVLWVPGTDHAGIGTEHVVERKLSKEGKVKRQIGREEFIKEVWRWKEVHGSTIMRQIKRLGCSCDYSRERFTMDEGLSRGVRIVFKKLFDEGLIYRGDYMVNWSPKLQTALSDDEVEYQEITGSLWHFRYPYADGSGYAVVATTRPETMLGDTAVAVNPDDPRYKHLIGRRVRLPLMDREIPIIGDAHIKTDFGTGMVKVTPAHDPNDYDMGKRHDLPFINLLHPDGRLNENAGPYAGLDMAKARERVVADMQAAGLLDKIEPHTHEVGHCYRSGCVVEPYISKQWFVKMRPLAGPAMEAVRDGRVRLTPATWEKTYFQWLDNVRDWCISRQLWWGHRVPVFTCEDCGHVECSIEIPERCSKCDRGRMAQDPDVLDTWFSSALWPFSTMGWPEKTPELARYYPTSVLVTAYDIIFFWVSRMIMMGLRFMEEVPFRDVYFTPLIMAEGGGKMSKSKGNAVDPLTLMDLHGTDAVRLTLTSHAAQGRQVNLSMKRFEGYRNFTNKLWNAARFVLMNVEDLSRADLIAGGGAPAIEDRWIRSELRKTIGRASQALASFEFDAYLESVYDFAWKQYCDWYVELVKPRLHSKDKPDFGPEARASRLAAQLTLVEVLDHLLRLLHPVAPFITEEIRQELRQRWGGEGGEQAVPILRSLAPPSIMLAPWPEAEHAGKLDPEAEARIGLLQEVVYQARKIRGEIEIPPGMKIELEVSSPDGDQRSALELAAAHLRTLLNLSSLRIADRPSEMARASTVISGNLTIRIPLPAELLERERERLAKEVARLATEIQKIQGKLGSENFASRAPAEVVERERQRLAEFEAERDELGKKLVGLS